MSYDHVPLLRDVPPMHLCVSPWARLDTEMRVRQKENSSEGSPWVMPEVTPPEACLPRQRLSMSSNGRLQRLLSNIPGWQRHHGSGGGDREEDSDSNNNNKKKRPRAMVAISVLSMYLLRGDATSNTGLT